MPYHRRIKLVSGYKPKPKPWYAKVARRGVRAVKKRYGGRKGTRQLIRDVSFLKSIVNAEKKRLTQSYLTNLAVGQVIGNAGGYYVTDVTPLPAQGSQVDQRSGSSIKLHASHFSFMVSQDTATINPITLHFYLFQIKGNYYASPATFVTDHWQTNTFIGGASIVDYNSDPDPDHFNNAMLLRRWRIKLPVDQVSGETTIKPFKIGHKYNRGQGHHIRYENNSTTITQGQILLVIFADNGNASPTTASTLTGGVPITAVHTGAILNYEFIHYYYDN